MCFLFWLGCILHLGVEFAFFGDIAEYEDALLGIKWFLVLLGQGKSWDGAALLEFRRESGRRRGFVLELHLNLKWRVVLCLEPYLRIFLFNLSN